MTFANEVNLCAACGYPTLGPDVCYYCRPLVAATLTPFPPSLAAAATAPEASAIVRTTAMRPRGPRADVDRSLSNSAASTFAAAG